MASQRRRTWSRFSSLNLRSAVPTLPPAPAPAPARPPLLRRPTIRNRPTPPPPPPAAPPSPPAQPSPPGAQAAPPPASPVSQATLTTSTSFQQSAKTTPQTKTDKENEPKIERKTVGVQETIDKPMKMHNVHKNGKLSDSEEIGKRAITLTGENQGDLMKLNPSLQKNENGKAKEEGKYLYKDKNTKEAMTTSSQPMHAVLNSNVQAANNSILSNSVCRHNDPGIHLWVARKSNGRVQELNHHG